MTKIIFKKGDVLNRNQYHQEKGLIKPLFNVDEGNKFIPVSASSYPNNGHVLVLSYDLLKNHIQSDFFCVTNDFFINDVTNPNYEDQAVSLKQIKYNSGISQFFEEIPFWDFIPIYKNKFDYQTKKLSYLEGIDNEIFFLEKNNTIWGPFKKNSLKLSPFNFRSEEDNYEDNIQFDNFLDIYIDYDGEYIFELQKDDIFNCIVLDSEQNSYLTEFKSIVEKKIGTPTLFSDDASILEWGKKKLEAQNPDISNNLVSFVNNYSTNSIDKDRWNRFRELIDRNSEELNLINELLLKKGGSWNIFVD